MGQEFISTLLLMVKRWERRGWERHVCFSLASYSSESAGSDVDIGKYVIPACLPVS